MGEWIKARNLKWGDDTERQLADLQLAFPWMANRSDAVRKMIAIVHVIVFTPGILEKITTALQGSECALFVRTLPSREGPGITVPGPRKSKSQEVA